MKFSELIEKISVELGIPTSVLGKKVAPNVPTGLPRKVEASTKGKDLLDDIAKTKTVSDKAAPL